MSVAPTVVRTTISLCSWCESNLSRNRLLQQDLEASARVAAHIAILLRNNKYIRTLQPTAFCGSSYQGCAILHLYSSYCIVFLLDHISTVAF